MRIVDEWKASYNSLMLMHKEATMSLSKRFKQGQGLVAVMVRLAPSPNALTDHQPFHLKYSIIQKLNLWLCCLLFRTSAASGHWLEVPRHLTQEPNNSMSHSRLKSATLPACKSLLLLLNHKTRRCSTTWSRGLRTKTVWLTTWCSRYSHRSRQPAIR